jgi:membrane-associated protease RseP (regulator of RpoE activity)
MKLQHFARTLTAAALVFALVPATTFADEKEQKRVKRTVIVKDGQVWTSDNDEPMKLREGAMVRRGYLGVNLIEITSELRDHYGVAKDSGVLVSRVENDSPAAKSGLRTGDVITAIDGVKVDSPGDVARAVRDKKNGETVKIEYSRDGAKSMAMAAVVERERPQIDLGALGDLGDLGNIDIRMGDVGKRLAEQFNSPEWKAKMERLGDCGKMQERLQQLETRLKEMERKLQK